MVEHGGPMGAPGKNHHEAGAWKGLQRIKQPNRKCDADHDPSEGEHLKHLKST